VYWMIVVDKKRRYIIEVEEKSCLGTTSDISNGELIRPVLTCSHCGAKIYMDKKTEEAIAHDYTVGQFLDTKKLSISCCTDPSFYFTDFSTNYIIKLRKFKTKKEFDVAVNELIVNGVTHER